MYCNVGWGDAQMGQLVEVFAQTPMRILRLYLHKNPDISASGLDQLASLLEKKRAVQAAEGEEGAVSNAENIHPGIQCDLSGVEPIKGPRFKLGQEDYDVCEAEFNKLSKAEQDRYNRIMPPEYIKCVETEWGVLPRMQEIFVDNPEHARLKAVCERRGIAVRPPPGQ